MTGSNGWAEHKKLVEYRLDRNDKKHEDLEKKMDEIHDAILTLKVKSSLWGAAAGSVPPLVAALAYAIHAMLQ